MPNSNNVINLTHCFGENILLGCLVGYFMEHYVIQTTNEKLGPSISQINLQQKVHKLTKK